MRLRRSATSEVPLSANVRARLSGDAEGREILRLLGLAHEFPRVVGYDPHTNFGYSTVQAGSTIIGSSGTPKTILLNTGDGASFAGGDGTTQFNIVVWPQSSRPLSANAEIIRCTRVGDTLTTVARHQEGSSALTTITDGYQVMAAVTKKTLTDLEASSGGPIGSVMLWPNDTPPTNYKNCDGFAILRASFPVVYGILIPQNNPNVTITNATPAVVSAVAHGLRPGASFFFTSSGTLPAPLAVNTLYYVIAAGWTADAFQLAASRGGAAINTTTGGSGVHVLWNCPYGLGDGASTFNLPDFRGRAAVGAGDATGHADVAYQGANEGVAITARRPTHRSSIVDTISVGGGPWAFAFPGGAFFGSNTPAYNASTSSPTKTGTVTAGPQTGQEPVDAPAYLTASYVIRVT
jgi:microcystin-dependent protein